MSAPGRKPQQSTSLDLCSIENTREHSELLRAECSRLIMETDKVCKHIQDDDFKRLDQHVKEIQFLKKELGLKLEEIVVETDSLIALQNRVVKALEACKDPLRVTVLCLEERKKHLPSDRLNDEVDLQLLSEREIIHAVASLLQHESEQITEQIRLNRSAKYRLEQDLRRKGEAEYIDNSCAMMTVHSLSGSQTAGNTKTPLPSLSMALKQWENISDVNIAKAEQQRTNSVSLRAMVESLLELRAGDLQRQLQATAAAFQRNVRGIKAAKGRMEEQLAKVLPELASQQRVREDLQVAIKEKERFLSLVKERLTLRRQKPAKEQCHDAAQSLLYADVQQLTAQINKLHEAVAQSEEEQRALIRCQLELQENIQIEASCLYVDEVICAQHRESMVIHNF